MGVTSWLGRRLTDRVFDKKVQPLLVDGDVHSSLMDSMPEGPMIRCRPQKDDRGLEFGRNLIDTLYTLRKGKFGIRNLSPRHSFEIWHADSRVQFRYFSEHQQLRERFRDQIEDNYPGTQVEPDKQMMPRIEDGDYVAGARMTLRREFWYPIRVPDGVDDFDRDPYGPITSEMIVTNEQTTTGKRVRSEDARVLIQVAFQPAKKSWSRGRGLGALFGADCETKGNELREGRLKDGLVAQITDEVEIEDASRKRRKAGEMISKQKGAPGFHARVRVLAISPFKEVARRRARNVAEVMETYYNSVTEQGLKTHPVRGSELRKMLDRIVRRRIQRRSRFPLLNMPNIRKLSAYKDLFSAREVAALAHLPASAEETKQGISTADIDWFYGETSPGLPPDMPTFERPSEKEGEA